VNLSNKKCNAWLRLLLLQNSAPMVVEGTIRRLHRLRRKSRNQFSLSLFQHHRWH
jgi:hypothetical protein